MNRRPHRAASLTVALVAAVLLAAPVWAAKPAGVGGGGGGGGGNEGSVRVVDAASDLESVTNNEPHVCAFYLVFEGAPSGENGSWSIVDWPPTGDGSLVTAGAYAIPAGGAFATATFEFDAGHYRVVWQAINAQTEKHKTFWVDDDCFSEPPADQPGDEVPPQDAPADEPTDEPPDEQPADEPTDEQPADEPADEPTDEPEGDVQDEIQEPPAPVEEPAEEPAPEQPPVDEPGPDGDLSPGAGGGPVVTELPDTAMSAPVLPGMGAALGLLFLVIAHRLLRDRGSRIRR